MQVTSIPSTISAALVHAHPSWHPCLNAALAAMDKADPAYLPALANSHFLPTGQRLFAAFALPLPAVRYVLVGEGPYPREASATGVCFMDGAVGSLWCENGLSKPVNRATSLRNFIKMLLVADGQLDLADTGAAAMAPLAQRALRGGAVQTLAQVQERMLAHGFLLLNAALVFRPEVAPAIDARGWRPFLQTVLATLADYQAATPPTLFLWGKIAEQLKALPETARLPQVLAEHPYNLSFIGNAAMQALFGPMRLLGGQAE